MGLFVSAVPALPTLALNAQVVFAARSALFFCHSNLRCGLRNSPMWAWIAKPTGPPQIFSTKAQPEIAWNPRTPIAKESEQCLDSHAKNPDVLISFSDE